MSEKYPEPSYQSSSGDSGRLRSVPYRSPFVWGGILALINYCGAIAILTTLPIFLLKPTHHAMEVLIGSMVFYAVTSIASFLKRRHILCPLCKGTPLISTGAHVHSKAFRVFPLDHGTTAMISVIILQKFRCMYCGARFDLLKPRPERHLITEDPAD